MRIGPNGQQLKAMVQANLEQPSGLRLPTRLRPRLQDGVVGLFDVRRLERAARPSVLDALAGLYDYNPTRRHEGFLAIAKVAREAQAEQGWLHTVAASLRDLARE